LVLQARNPPLMGDSMMRYKTKDVEGSSPKGGHSELTDDDDDSKVLIPGAPTTSRQLERWRPRHLLCAAVAAIGAVALLTHGLLKEWADVGVMHAVTWNIAAINNNPFEYWITHEDADYNRLMEAVQEFIDNPQSRDVQVSEVFTPVMWKELRQLMERRGWSGLAETDALWQSDFSRRAIISGFMKDKSLGDKRLASMPDRYTNTINTLDQGTANRPTVINCFAGDMTSVSKWWAEWKRFMFQNKLKLPGGANGPLSTEPAGMLSKIKRSKYPAITAEEEAISIPLQTLAQAIFDAILVHIVNTVSPGGKWQQLQQQMCDALNRKKDEHTIGILESYSEANVVFLQEAASAFMAKADDSDLGDRYIVSHSGSLDGKRDQNSVILLSKTFFREATIREHTSAVMNSFTTTVPVSNGDLYVLSVEDTLGRQYLLASFHGDTNGLATLPVLAAVHQLATTLPSHRLIFGLDANTYEVGTASLQGMSEFAADFVSKGYSSCWGDTPDPKSHTTFNARTFLQAQLQKAARADQKISKGDKNPKDFIIFPKSGFSLLSSAKDNTGSRKYVEDMVFPTLQFPSDHGLVYTKLKVN